MKKGQPDPPAGLSRQAAARWQEQVDSLVAPRFTTLLDRVRLRSVE